MPYRLDVGRHVAKDGDFLSLLLDFYFGQSNYHSADRAPLAIDVIAMSDRIG